MKRRALITALVMLLLPWLAITVVPGNAGMVVCLLLFYVVDPAYAIVNGYTAGKDIRRLWSSPVITAALFLLGAWVFFAPGEPQFAAYALVYLLLGTAAMLLSAWLENRRG